MVVKSSLLWPVYLSYCKGCRMVVESGLQYVEKSSRKDLSAQYSHFSWICGILVGYLAPALLPPLHIGLFYYLWHQYARHVDKRYCSCSCWDTVFKGTYESGIASYKHVYFNATINTLKMWVLTVAAVVLLYECVRKLTLLAVHRRLRLSMLILFISSLFSHYYSWWIFLNYWNDDFFSQWNHQLFFSLTEVLSTALVMRLADSGVTVTPRAVLGIIAIAGVHVLTSCWDQFVYNVVQGEGYMHQVLRDLSFMMPDLLHISLPIWELNRAQRLTMDIEMRRYVFALSCLVTIGFVVSTIL